MANTSKSRRARRESQLAHELEIEECQAETQVSPEELNRVCALLARWASRRGQNVLEDAGINPKNRVTGGGIKGYDGKNGSN